ncbi:hypothetical protein RFI_38805, partial [Reticulomyxa filosa]
MSIKCGSNELINTILSGSSDNIVRLWDIRSGQQICVFSSHFDDVACVEYSPFVKKSSSGNSAVICSGSLDNTIRFWDIRSYNIELYSIKGCDEYDEISCLKFVSLKNKVGDNEQNDCGIHLYYGSNDGPIH